ncbi:MAG: hypothetical protein LBC26_08145 [Oscillospiraceae bacterium]|nr:hypothetical protein [Oscillospiraceae bacterium]
MITCTESCIYQQEGACRLEQAASVGQANRGCVHFIGRAKPTKPPPRGAS